MRARRLLLPILLLTLWWAWPHGATVVAPPPHSEPITAAPVTRTVRAAPRPLPDRPSTQLDDETVSKVLRGEFGLAIRNDLCGLCIDERFEHRSCHQCDGSEDAGRVLYDVVDSDGRPYPPFEIMLKTDCTRSWGLDSGFVDLPPGDCTLTPSRIEAPFEIRGPSVTVHVTPGSEQYVLFRLSSEPWGATGLMLDFEDGGIRVIEDLGTADHDIPVGAMLLAVDGALLGEQTAHDVGEDLLSGPAGTVVDILVGYETEEGWVERTVPIERRPLTPADVGVRPGSPG